MSIILKAWVLDILSGQPDSWKYLSTESGFGLESFTVFFLASLYYQ